ncbi:MAG: TonB-dependent receptor [Algibacter sp.]
MRTFIFLFFTTVFALTPNNIVSQNSKIKVEEDKMLTVDEVFKLIKNQTDYRFFYEEDLFKNFPKVQVKKGVISTNKLLKRSLSTGNLNITVTANNAILIKEKLTEETAVNQQDYEVYGIVTDANGQPLPGANIIEKGTSNGTQTDFDGNFSLNVAGEDAILVVSYIGFVTKEVSPNNEASLTITLVEDASKLDEVVVVGYGTSTKEKFNGSVSKVSSKKLNTFSSANFEQALSGTVSGVQVLSNGKNPGDNSVIQIRGLNTLTAGTNPLIVVDGNPLSEGSSLSSVNTNDIASINILKDAASASIYGSRASNGVILITTKKGTKGELKVSYNGYLGVQSRIDNFELADAYDTALFDLDSRNFGYLSGGTGRSITDDNATRDANGGGKRSRIPTYLQGYIDGTSGLTNTDWLDEVFRSAYQQNHYVNLSGGDEKSNYSVSLGYLDQENIIVGSDYKRYTNNIRFNSQISDRVKFGININTSYSDTNPSGDTGWSETRLGRGRQADPAFSVVLMQPYYSVYNADGSLNIAEQINDNNDNWDGPISENTIAHVLLSDFTRDEFRVFGNAFLEFEPIENLTFKTSFGGDYNTSTEEFFAPSTFGNYRTPVANSLTLGAKYDTKRENFIVENILNYKKTIKKHTFDVLLGHSYQQEFRNETDLESQDFADNNIRNVNGGTTITAISESSKWALESYFTRLQYDYDNKYTLSASIRRDGSSRFGVNTKYGNFASVSGGWILSNESFFPEDAFVNYAKVRASWGETGNNQIGDFGSVSLIEPDNYVLNGSLTSGVNTSTSPNPDLSWETNTAKNFGLDLGFMNNQLFLTAEYYISNTTDLLLDVPVPEQSGFSESLQNIGEIENKGFELELKGRNFSIGDDLKIGFNANISHTNNEVLALGNGQDQIIFGATGSDFITKVGESVAEFYNVNVIGVYRTQAEIDSDPITPLAGTEVGDYIVEDVNGDGVITTDDRTSQGDFNPDFTYGFGFTMNYKGFDMSAQFTGVEGRKVVDNLVYRSETGEGFFVPTQYYVDNYFSDRNPDGFFRRPDFSSFSSAARITTKSNLTVLDGDYFRLRSLQLGYTLPDNITDKLSIENLRIYFTGNNIFNITNYRGYNSEAVDTRQVDGSNERQSLGRGYINSASPLTRFMALGLDIKF